MGTAGAWPAPDPDSPLHGRLPPSLRPKRQRIPPPDFLKLKVELARRTQDLGGEVEMRPREVCKKSNFEEKEMARRHGEEDEQGSAKDMFFFFFGYIKCIGRRKIFDPSNGRKISDKLYLPYFDTPFY